MKQVIKILNENTLKNKKKIEGKSLTNFYRKNLHYSTQIEKKKINESNEKKI